MLWNKKPKVTEIRPMPEYKKNIKVGDRVGAEWLERGWGKTGFGKFLGYTNSSKTRCNVELELTSSDSESVALVDHPIENIFPCLDVDGKNIHSDEDEKTEYES